ncbi:MAG: hypothetical protein ACOYD0_09215 [Candidatus Nanopelagicales bacterium]
MTESIARDRAASGGPGAPLKATPPGSTASVASGALDLPVTLLGTNPASWLTAGVASINLVSVGAASAGLITAAALPVRLAALGSLSSQVARLTVSAGGAAAGALIDLSTPSARPSRSFGDAYEDAV